jgi:hypothetical protein
MAVAPILLNSCARAATAAEARYRLDYPITPSRATRVIALDEGAELTLREVAAQPWAYARFFVARPPSIGSEWSPADGLHTLDGRPVPLAGQLEDASGVVMLVTADTAAAAAATIGAACTVRGIMTAGLILGQHRETHAAVSAMRPHARVLMVTEDEHDVAEVLSALRA